MKLLLSISSCLMLLLGEANDASAQLRMISKEKLSRVSRPVLSKDSSAFAFEISHIHAAPMNEEDDPVTFRFPFRNVADHDLCIDRLVTSCSCVTAVCPVSKVSPGEASEITVTYHPKGHPGRFERRIYLYSGDDSPAAVLRLSVSVDAGKDISMIWPVQMGPIHLRHARISFRRGNKAVESIHFINVGGRALELECERAFLPGCLSFHTEPSVVADGAEGEIVMSYDPSAGKCPDEVKVILKGLGLPPSASSFVVTFDN